MDLSIIIVSFNTKKLLLDCVNSIFNNTKKIVYEIIIVDNGSSDGSAHLTGNFKLIGNKENLGFAKANNQGIEKAKGRYILLLNSDTVILDNVLGEMVEWMGRNSKVGIVSCSLKNKDGSLQATGGYFPTLPRVFAWMFFLDDFPILERVIKSFHPHQQNYLKEHQQDWVTGAFFLIRRQVIDEIGLIDEDYFMYVEEVDFCFRAKQKKWEIWYLSEWSITHLGGASGHKGDSLIQELRSIKIFYKKHMPKWQYPVLRFFLKTGALGRIILNPKIYAKAFREI
ncbi:hypothetical protein A3D00_05030 [Candidatus Woesebacteria bacterium RIFCSPHIGHO2_02_FULL_38_9]|uniref:Glycosyltransferase 2-like domain-containing protein n=1 Tax=Candidatus Woesebacteria bacterium RIFCSPHIGHO2_01_FULL_39_28 TaxID=1802496 RepID=A0A1F7YCP0_9BACT|nr:MAG: hypothetical protein A2627_02905 [Candidatus Woesebacteria bacterium RIFCSPHIGHO2_01_FULL_39_28]OGM32367.1 MAG: hypothetical protein A3D00_05030 [Candidatus Woesebacteria bacterium RIFCSPHIGHO2_02_FULL_38_9]OGM58055.1 MAG: hypothetical protein A3A50_01915 [Candidatus Woesebacteria bacterium RIFCSPLOWO2_01_FULL_38_20]